MYLAQQWRLLGLAALVIAVDLVWAAGGHFQIDMIAYARLAALAILLLGAGVFYQEKRNEPALAAMLLGASFLVIFSAGASVLNYFLLTVAGSRIDTVLVKADRMMGFDWYHVMVTMANHPMLNALLFRIYNMVLPEVALVLVVLAWSGRIGGAYRYCIALAVGALIAIGVWTLMPSLGAKSLYVLPPEVTKKLTLSVTCDYGAALVALLHNGPGYITPADMRGLIAFPSYHGVLAVIMAFYAWQISWLRWPALLFNAVVIVSSPIQGGHHMVDLLGSFPVAALAIFIASRSESASLVNKLSPVSGHSGHMAAIPCHHDTSQR